MDFDADLIEASFAKEYGIRLSKERDMRWREFAALLSGLSGETALGAAVAIRAETDAGRIRAYGPGARRVYDEWRAFLGKGAAAVSDGTVALQAELLRMFGV